MLAVTWQRLAVIAVGTGAIAWAVTRMAVSQGMTPQPVPWTVVAFGVIAAALGLMWAWEVRQFVRGKRPGLAGLRAARIAAFALAVVYAGALLAGAYAGYGAGLLPEWSHLPRREVAVTSLRGVAAGTMLWVAGWIAQGWCRSGGPDNDSAAEAA